jgi:asparagine synthase
MEGTTPCRVPLACGALGDYDRARVERMAALLGGGLRVAHEDRDSVLMLDRPAFAWEGRREQGIGWIEGDAWRGGAASWREAARLGACGLVVAGRRRLVHSSVSGLASVFWMDGEGATYFASRLDPLVRSSPVALSVDWDAWASIFAVRFALGDRTPFAEIRRLGPHAALRRRFGRGRVESPAWPWAEIEPHLDIEAGTEATVAALRESLAHLEGEVLCPLSGGFDSRALISILATSGRAEPVAITVNDDEGTEFEEGFASPVAAALGVRHELLRAPVEDYWTDWEEHHRRIEHRFVDHPWLMPLVRRVSGARAPVPDGYALDTFLLTGARFHTAEVLDISDPRASNRALFDGLRRYGHTHEGLDERFHAGILDNARGQFDAVVEPFTGHPSQPLLTLYATRTVGGISTYPSALLGTDASTVVPGAQDAVVAPILAVSPEAKRYRTMLTALQRQLLPSLAEMESTNDVLRPERRTLPRRWRSEVAIEGHRRLVADGPLAEHVSPQLTAWLEDPRGEMSPHLRAGMEAVSFFHHWWGLYRGVLRDGDARALLG